MTAAGDTSEIADLARLRASSSRMASCVQIVRFCAHAGVLWCAVVASGEVGQAQEAGGGHRVGAARAYSTWRCTAC